MYIRRIMQMVGTVLWFGSTQFKTSISTQYGQDHFADDIFKYIISYENCCISIKISPKFALNGPINNKTALVEIKAPHRTGDKALSEPTVPEFTEAYMRYSI